MLDEFSDTNLKAQIIYALFQKKVMEDDFGAFESFTKIKRQQEAHNIIKKHWEQSNDRFGTDNDVAVIIMSGSKSNIGVVIDANSEIQPLLGFNKNDLVGENVFVLMPEIIGVHHNSYIENYFKNNVQSNLNDVIQELVFAQHIDGYIIPCYKMVRMIPNLENGIQFIGFLSLAKDITNERNNERNTKNLSVIFFMLNDHYDIIGLNKDAAMFCCKDNIKDANIKKYLENEQKINLRKIYPEFFYKENIEQIYSAEGLQIAINLNLIRSFIGSEIIDIYEFSNNEINANIKYFNTYNSNNENDKIVLENPMKTITINAKFEKHVKKTKMGSFIICSIFSAEQQILSIMDYNEENKKSETKSVIDKLNDCKLP